MLLPVNYSCATPPHGMLRLSIGCQSHQASCVCASVALPRLFPAGVEIFLVSRANGTGRGDRRCRTDETHLSVAPPLPSSASTYAVYGIVLLLTPCGERPDTSTGLLVLASQIASYRCSFPWTRFTIDLGIWPAFRDRHLWTKIGSFVPRTGAEGNSASRSRERVGDSFTTSGKRLSASSETSALELREYLTPSCRKASFGCKKSKLSVCCAAAAIVENQAVRTGLIVKVFSVSLGVVISNTQELIFLREVCSLGAVLLSPRSSPSYVCPFGPMFLWA